MLTEFYARQSPGRRRLIVGLVHLGMIGLLIAISIRGQDIGNYILTVGLVVLGMTYGSLRTTTTWLESYYGLLHRYRLAWLSARRRANGRTPTHRSPN